MKFTVSQTATHLEETSGNIREKPNLVSVLLQRVFYICTVLTTEVPVFVISLV
jgi:hypothetical protein